MKLVCELSKYTHCFSRFKSCGRDPDITWGWSCVNCWEAEESM
jgi:hypothetical protein